MDRLVQGGQNIPPCGSAGWTEYTPWGNKES